MPNVKFYNYREEKTETLSEYKEEMEKTHSKYAKLRQEVTLLRTLHTDTDTGTKNRCLLH